MRKIDFIVVHTGQPDSTTILNAARAKDKQPAFHYHISAGGKLVELGARTQNSELGHRSARQCICISVESPGLKSKLSNKSLNPAQEDALFNKIVQISERHTTAQIVGKDHFDAQEYPSQPFNVRSWLASYVPDLGMVA